jgi:hypothetical protein
MPWFLVFKNWKSTCCHTPNRKTRLQDQVAGRSKFPACATLMYEGLVLFERDEAGVTL